MPEWLHETFRWLFEAFHYEAGLPLSQVLRDVAVRLAAALILGCVVAGIYRLTHGKANGQSMNLMATLVMLTVLIAMVTLVIGENQARAFSLVGALAIIRFRTVVEDTRDTAFVIFAVAVGMGAGAGFIVVPVLGIPFAALAAFLFRSRESETPAVSSAHVLVVRIGTGHEPETLLRGVFDKHLQWAQVRSMATARQGAAFELTYDVRLRRDDAALAMLAELNTVQGIQNVELRRA